MCERERERLRGLGVLLEMKVSEHEDGEGKQGELYILQRRRKKCLQDAGFVFAKLLYMPIG